MIQPLIPTNTLIVHFSFLSVDAVLTVLSPSFLFVFVFSFLTDGYLVCINIDKDTNAMPTLSKYYNNNDNDNKMTE
jgi:hypothetical protein